MGHHFDMNKVDAEIATMVAKISEGSEANDAVGARKRALLAILPAAIRWKAAEHNRGTPIDHTMEAIMTVTSNLAVTELNTVDAPLEVKFDAFNEFLTMLAQNVGRILTNPNPLASGTIVAETAGHG